MNNNKKNYDYGNCHVCGEQMQEKRINQDFWLKGKLVVIESVPAGVCPQCGEKIVKADVGRQLGILRKSQAPAQAKDYYSACGSICEGSCLVFDFQLFFEKHRRISCLVTT